MERVLITGAKGRLGAALVEAAWPIGTFVIPATPDQVDLTDPASVDRYVAACRPDVIINAASFPSVDDAEHRPELAQRINHRAVEYLASAAATADCRLIQMSSAYVFDGVCSDGYVEGDQVNPLGTYGRSKRAGERAALALDGAVVLRTSWLYGADVGGWLHHVRAVGQRRPGLGVVNDRFGSPTAIPELC